MIRSTFRWFCGHRNDSVGIEMIHSTLKIFSRVWDDLVDIAHTGILWQILRRFGRGCSIEKWVSVDIEMICIRMIGSTRNWYLSIKIERKIDLVIMWDDSIVEMIRSRCTWFGLGWDHLVKIDMICSRLLWFCPKLDDSVDIDTIWFGLRLDRDWCDLFKIDIIQ